MKRWIIGLLLVAASSAYAMNSANYEKDIRETITKIDAHYTNKIQTLYASDSLDIVQKKKQGAAIQTQWNQHRADVYREMTQIHTELRSYEDKQLNTSMRIRAKLQQTVGEIQQWRNAEVGRLNTGSGSEEEKSRKRLEINRTADEKTRQIHASAAAHETALRQLNARAEKPMFTPDSDGSSFALQHPK